MKLHRRLTQRRLFIEEGGRPFIKSRRRLFYLTHITPICREKAVCWERPFVERGGHATREEADHQGREEAVCQGRLFIEGGWRQFVEGRRRLLYLTHITHRRTFVGRRLFVEKGCSSREGAIHQGREEAVHWGRETIHQGRGETICQGRGKTVHWGRGQTVHQRQEETVHQEEAVCWESPFIESLFIEREGHSSREGGGHLSREGGGHLSREGGTGRRPFIKRRGCSSKAIHQGREAIHWGREEEAIHWGRGEYSLLWWEERTVIFHVGKFKIQHGCMMLEFEWTSWIVAHGSRLGNCVWLFLNCLVS